MIDYAIIGAGLTGLTAAWDLVRKTNPKSLHIFEKSKGCGGRMATRRVGDCRFDHGAQFIKKNEASDPWIDLWKASGFGKKFIRKNDEVFCAENGMTSFAKILAQDLPISYECKILSLKYSGEFWTLFDDQSREHKAKNIIITSPLPQALEILRRSNLPYDSKLDEITYAKALVLLLELSDDEEASPFYQDFSGENISSVCFQKAKGTSLLPALTAIMSTNWSLENFDLAEEEILRRALPLIQAAFPALKIAKGTLKKWLYSHPLSSYERLFEQVAPGLYLAGDAFGGPSLPGALRSSGALVRSIE